MTFVSTNLKQFVFLFLTETTIILNQKLFMKAVILQEINQTVSIQEVETPQAGAGEAGSGARRGCRRRARAGPPRGIGAGAGARGARAEGLVLQRRAEAPLRSSLALPDSIHQGLIHDLKTHFNA